MRIVLKIIFFPIRIVTTVISLFLRFLSELSGALLGFLSVLLFLFAVLILILLKDPQGALTASIFAFLIGPYGLPRLASWIVDRLDDFISLLKSI